MASKVDDGNDREKSWRNAKPRLDLHYPPQPQTQRDPPLTIRQRRREPSEYPQRWMGFNEDLFGRVVAGLR